MLSWILFFLVIAVLASAIGATAVGHTLASIAWVLFVVFAIMLVVSFVTGRRPAL